MGAVLHRERDLVTAGTTALMLVAMFPENELPIQIQNINLRSFANAIWQSRSAADVAVTLKRAAASQLR